MRILKTKSQSISRLVVVIAFGGFVIGGCQKEMIEELGQENKIPLRLNNDDLLTEDSQQDRSTDCDVYQYADAF